MLRSMVGNRTVQKEHQDAEQSGKDWVYFIINCKEILSELSVVSWKWKGVDQSSLTSHTINDLACTLQVPYHSCFLELPMKIQNFILALYSSFEIGAWTASGDTGYFRKPVPQCHPQEKTMLKRAASQKSNQYLPGMKEIIVCFTLPSTDR